MIVQNHRAMAAFAVVVGLMSAVAAAFGVFARGDGSYEIVTSVRGVTYPMATSGVYAYNAQRVVAEGVGWDVFTLFVAVPTMLAAAAFVAGGSFRGRLLASGLFGYFLYQYLEYAMTWAFGPLFPLFVLIFGASLVGLVWFGASVARDGIADRFGADFPGRAFAVVSVVMAILLVVTWTARIAAGLSGDLEAAGLQGETTLVVQALDLGLVVPTALLIAALAWRRTAVGQVLASIYVVTSVSMSAAIVAMLLSAGMVEAAFELPPILIFGAFLVAMLALAIRMYRPTSRDTYRAPEGGLRWQPK
jgi:hypothetical protein